MRSNSIKVFAPASISNVGPGFDIMGFTIDNPGDEIIVNLVSGNRVIIKKITGDNGRLPYEINKNTTTVAILSLLKKNHVKIGFDITINKGIGIGSGLGSSAACAVAGAYAVNELLDLKLTKGELLEHALAGEKIASGGLHADNVAPCLFGGFVLIKGYDPLEIVPIKYPRDLYCTVLYPHIEIKTYEARRILSKKITRTSAIAQAGNAASLIAGLLTNNLELISKSTTDFIAEPERARLIPCYSIAHSAALEAGALNCNISGSGPSMFAFSDSKIKAEQIGTKMQRATTTKKMKSTIYISKINPTGPVVLP